MRVRVLGSGTSNGVPVVGCGCPVCTSANTRNKRTRASVLISEGTTNILIDTATEFRLQAVAAGIDHLDGIFFTHAHADHTHGLDDVRSLTRKKPVDVYADPLTRDEILQRFSYIFRPKPNSGAIPRVNIHSLPGRPDGTVRCGGVEVRPIPIFHGKMEIRGYRVGGVAYLTDCSFIPESSFALLEGLDLLILDALRYKPHPTHFSVDEALSVIRRIAPGRALLTHMCHDLEYGRLATELPEGVSPAYDGLEIELPYFPDHREVRQERAARQE